MSHRLFVSTSVVVVIVVLFLLFVVLWFVKKAIDNAVGVGELFKIIDSEVHPKKC